MALDGTYGQANRQWKYLTHALDFLSKKSNAELETLLFRLKKDMGGLNKDDNNNNNNNNNNDNDNDLKFEYDNMTDEENGGQSPVSSLGYFRVNKNWEDADDEEEGRVYQNNKKYRNEDDDVYYDNEYEKEREREREREKIDFIKQNNKKKCMKNSIFDSNYTVFDSLYDGRKDSARTQYEAKKKRENVEKTENIFTYTPNTGINRDYPVEKNKTDFFNRLYDTRIQFDINARDLSQRMFDKERGIVGHGGKEKKDIFLTDKEKEELFHRYVRT